jgi:serine/threonine protein kinase
MSRFDRYGVGDAIQEKYVIERFLGAGNFGSVYLLQDQTKNIKYIFQIFGFHKLLIKACIFLLKLNKRRALKVMTQTEFDSETLTEIELLKNVYSPYIIKYYDHFLLDKRIFHLIMEYCPVNKIPN